ncbi:hypothetical protein BYT27DRAFT_7209863 [Phlegmacium glaucopus]|nr:hypothetical protein BYT27DRAFT_7209863 [Phlegmacium glaucopus]
MSLMQMVADAYENAYDMGEHDDESSRGSPSLNEAQETVRAWLGYAGFLPPLPRKQFPAVSSLYEMAFFEATSRTHPFWVGEFTKPLAIAVVIISFKIMASKTRIDTVIRNRL